MRPERARFRCGECANANNERLYRTADGFKEHLRHYHGAKETDLVRVVDVVDVKRTVTMSNIETRPTAPSPEVVAEAVRMLETTPDDDGEESTDLYVSPKGWI